MLPAPLETHPLFPSLTGPRSEPGMVLRRRCWAAGPIPEESLCRWGQQCRANRMGLGGAGSGLGQRAEMNVPTF